MNQPFFDDLDFNDELTIAARVKQWDIFKPDWEFLSQHPSFTLASLVGQSFEIHPYFCEPAWVFNIAIPYFKNKKTLLLGDIDQWYQYENNLTEEPLFNYPDDEKQELLEYIKEIDVKLLKLNNFIEYIHVAVRNITPYGELMPIDGVVCSVNTMIKHSDFVAFALKNNWVLPMDFKRSLFEVKPKEIGHIKTIKPSKNQKRDEFFKIWLNEEITNAKNNNETFNINTLKKTDIQNALIESERKATGTSSLWFSGFDDWVKYTQLYQGVSGRKKQN